MAGNESKAKAIHLLISGRVQGVAFRYYTREKATDLGLAGWVRNLSDGRVEAFAEGEKQIIDRFIDWCHSGPPSARVDEIVIDSRDPQGTLESFSIRHDG